MKLHYIAVCLAILVTGLILWRLVGERRGSQPASPVQHQITTAPIPSPNPANSGRGPPGQAVATAAPNAPQGIAPAVSTSPGYNRQISANALIEMQAMAVEKASFTPAQRKLDSQIVFALKRTRNESIANGKVPELKIGLQPDSNGMVLVEIAATKPEIGVELRQRVESVGGVIKDSLPRVSPLCASLPLRQAETIAALPEVKFIRPVMRAMVNNSDPQGVFAHRAEFARTNFYVDGSGVKVGVLSDSVDYLAEAQSNGALGEVTVLPGQSGVPAEGEGTAMLEIVHAMAPGAQLFYATGNGPTNEPLLGKQFATNILNLRFTYGCDIIVDDLTSPVDFPFQDTIIAQAVDAVTASGGLYFSSAANSGNLDSGTSGTWEGDFLSGGFLAFPTNGFIHNFGTVVSQTNYDVVTQKSSSGYATLLYWSDPVDFSTNDYDLYVLDSSGTHIISSSVNWQIGAAEPIEAVPPPDDGQRIVIVLASGASRFLHLDVGRGHLAAATQGNVRGHNAATNALTVAAVDTATADPFLGFTGGTANPVESFSSDGPRRMFFYPDGTPMTPGNFSSTGGILWQKPNIAAADDVSTTLPPGGLNPFSGTSAAAPHAAAIAALVKSYNTNLTAVQIGTILSGTALDITPPTGVDRDSGHGIVMPAAALQAAPAPPPLITAVTPDSSFAGRPVYIYGYSFRTTTNVQIGGVSVPFVTLSNAFILTIVPSGTTNGGLQVSTPYGTVSAPFVVVPTPSPTNDNFANSVALTGTAFIVSAYTAGAGKEGGEPNHAGNTGGKSVWYRWTAPGNGNYTLDTIGSDFNTLLAVYIGSNLGSLSLVASNINSGSNGTSLLTFNAAAGTTYQIAVDGFGGASGNAILRIEPATTTIFSTAFEPAEGYVASTVLTGHNGWTNNGTGGNGIVTNLISGQGQQAFVGFSAPTPASNVFVFHPLNYPLDTNSRPLIQFSTTMEIVDSSNPFIEDQFWWIVRNTNHNPLIGLQWNNSSKSLTYYLDNGTSQFITGYLVNQVTTLSIAMDFGRNVWNATYGGLPIVPSFPSPPPITASGAPLNLGDVDAGWVISFSGSPGDNFMLFDNYTVTAGPSVVPRILAGPQSQTVIAGSDIFLGVAAAATAPLSYQWYYNNNAIPNATNATLALRNVFSAQSGSYGVVAGNINGSASGAALITITNPPPSARFAMPGLLASNGVQLNLSLANGNNYRLQASTNLVDWSTLTSFYADGTNTVCLDSQGLRFTTRFYRLISP